jgi:Flp pilus assembly protein TadD
MKRLLLIVIVTVPALLAISAAVFRKPSGAEPPLPSKDRGDARRLWQAAVEGTTSNQHELKALEASLKQNPGHAPILVRMAQVSLQLGNRAQAIRHLQQAVEAEPRNRDARLELGKALFESDDVEGAIRETKRLLEVDPYNTDGLYNLGAIYANLGQNDRAREYWTKAVAVDPDSDGAQRPRDALAQLDK